MPTGVVFYAGKVCISKEKMRENLNPSCSEAIFPSSSGSASKPYMVRPDQRMNSWSAASPGFPQKTSASELNRCFKTAEDQLGLGPNRLAFTSLEHVRKGGWPIEATWDGRVVSEGCYAWNQGLCCLEVGYTGIPVDSKTAILIPNTLVDPSGFRGTQFSDPPKVPHFSKSPVRFAHDFYRWVSDCCGALPTVPQHRLLEILLLKKK